MKVDKCVSECRLNLILVHGGGVDVVVLTPPEKLLTALVLLWIFEL